MKLSLIGALSLIVLCFACSASGQPLVLGTLEWPPFVSQELADQGPVTARVRAICAAAGMSLELSFAPWKRVLRDASTGTTHGFFPEYHSAHREKVFYFSRPVGCSVVGLVHRRDVTLGWTRLEDLASFRIGVVDGYVNTEEFDRLVDKGVLQPVKCNSDVLALRMVEAGRIDAAVMDRSVFQHLSSEGASPETLTPLVFDEHILAVHSLHVCFSRTPAGKALAKRFDQAVLSSGLASECVASPESTP